VFFSETRLLSYLKLGQSFKVSFGLNQAESHKSELQVLRLTHEKSRVHFCFNNHLQLKLHSNIVVINFLGSSLSRTDSNTIHDPHQNAEEHGTTNYSTNCDSPSIEWLNIEVDNTKTKDKNIKNAKH